MAVVSSPAVFIAAGSRMTTVDTRMQCSSLGSSITPSTRQPSAATNLTLNPFGFESKTAFNASNELTRSRSERFALRPPVLDDDIWKRPPPDFRPQVYQPKPPKRNSRESMKPENYGTFPGHQKTPKQDEKVFLPSIFRVLSGEKSEEAEFHTHVHIMDSYEAKRDAAKNLTNAREQYTLPEPHDHRGLKPIKPLGLPEFETNYERDPFNIKFHTRNLRTIHGLGGKGPTEREVEGLQMAPPLKQPPKWESRLILPNFRWRTPYCAYTRYRLPWRYPEQVLMDQVEDSLNDQWGQEREVKEEAAKAMSLKPARKAIVNENRDNENDVTPSTEMNDSENGSWDENV